MTESARVSRGMWGYVVLSYIALLFNAAPFLFRMQYEGVPVWFFAVSVYLVYCLFYMVGGIAVLGLIEWAVRFGVRRRFLKGDIFPRWIVYVSAVLLISFIQILVFTDRAVSGLFGFHLNGFVWNLIFTKGGIESMGGSGDTTLVFGGVIFGFVVLQSFLVAVWAKWGRLGSFFERLFSKKVCFGVIAAYVLMGFFQGFAYGLSSLYDYRPILDASYAMPFYQPITFAGLAKSVGVEEKEKTGIRLKDDWGLLRYPLRAIERSAEGNRYNIVWLVAESLRGDMVNKEVMPATSLFGEKSVRFLNHYSGGNGTRMGLFAMFYGLYGNYWFKFLDQHRGPVLMDMLIEDGYQMEMFTSARFSYPEFDKTIFAGVDKSRLHENGGSDAGWRLDRKNVDSMLEFINKRDVAKPFMTFMFFESPHARYYFPPECEIKKQYLEEFNYATVDLRKDIGLIKNRYINSCNHLDQQLGRIIACLEGKGLLDSTIVIITSDHGEEFMEKGHWGHNSSSYTQEQIVCPLILWVPGEKARQVKNLTSHLDIPATLMNLMGVKNDPADYSLGYDLLGQRGREFAVLSGWEELVYLDDNYKAYFPLKGYGLAQKQSVTSVDDSDIADKSGFYESHRQRLVEVMGQMSRFCGKQGKR